MGYGLVGCVGDWGFIMAHVDFDNKNIYSYVVGKSCYIILSLSALIVLIY